MATALSGASGIIAKAMMRYGAQFGTDNTSGVLNVSHETSLSLAFASCDEVATDIRVLAAGANEDLDLAGGLLDPGKNAVTFADVVAILVENRSGETLTSPAHTASAAVITVKEPAANGVDDIFIAAGDGIILKPGDAHLFLFAVPRTVTGGTGDLLNVAETTTTDEAAYSITIFGNA